ncbi:MAG: hypothetical protein Tsb002_09260 [Wenzhouxiangellaceae bacterium]
MKAYTYRLLVGLSLLAFVPLMAQAQDTNEPCWTLEQGDNCGVAATGSTIECRVGSGPSFVRIAPATYKCKAAERGLTGQKRCDNTGDKVHELLVRYGCNEAGVYTEMGTTELSSCHSAKLSGGECVGTAEPAADSVQAFLDSL